MKLHFKDQTFSFELLRATSYAPYGGAEIGECLATAARIREGDFESWHVEWRRTAERVNAVAARALSDGHRLSAREAFLRASNYYRTAEFFLAPDDPRQLVIAVRLPRIHLRPPTCRPAPAAPVSPIP